jgi:hypothetical protein
MGELSTLGAEGIALLVEGLGEQTGTLYDHDGTQHAFTDAAVASEGREARSHGKTDLRTRVLVLAASGVDAEPRARWRVTFTGDSAVWTVQEAEPIAPGGTVSGWRLALTDVVDRED